MFELNGRNVITASMRDITERKKIEEELRESEEKYRTFFNSSTEGILIAEIETRNFKYANPAICQMFGYSEKELKTMDITAIHPKEALQSILAKFQNLTCGIYSPATNIPCLRKDGTIFYADINNTNIIIDGRKCAAGFFHDITERKQAEEALEESRKTAERYLNVAAEIIISMDALGNITLINDSGCQLLGYNRNELIGKNWFKTCLPDEMISDVSNIFKKLIDGDIENATNYENAVKTKSGEIKIILWHNTILKDSDGNITGTISSGEDITERKNTENKIIHLGYYDKLTEIYNRRFIEEEIKRLDTKRNLPLSIVMGDLNSLKLTNDAFGHSIGDTLLQVAAGMLKKICRSDDILARWGGDEFVILLPKTSMADSEEIVARIKKECSGLVISNIPLGLAVGIATKTEAAQDIQTTIIDAENNMYKNKLAEKESSASSIIFALEQTLFEKSNETLEHAIRIKDNALKLGRSAKLHSNQLDELSLLASLHDIGKVAIPETILLKEGNPTEEEWAVIKRHPEIGFNIAASSPHVVHTANFILACHENWDGSGYPKGLKGEKIPIVSRIIFICDAYDVMTNERAYKKTMSKDDAIKELKRCSGTQFDPVLVEKFIEIISS
ncbi:MAG: PAS domain S-box protein [Candidatus Humimicrobiaceae bacterium]